MGFLREAASIGGPFLVVVPLSTVPNWIRELRKWLPSANSVVYVGDTRSREVIRHYEFTGMAGVQGAGGAAAGGGRDVALRPPRATRFDVLVTTYELVLKDAAHLARIRWAYLVVDEAHRLKNADAALYRGLGSMHFRNKLLVTGTPLQNSLTELWALLHFLEPSKFDDADAFDRAYGDASGGGGGVTASKGAPPAPLTAAQVGALHGVLRPHLLRRVIRDVEKSLPPKSERILRVGMTPLQKRYYRWILTRNFRDLNRVRRTWRQGGELKKKRRERGGDKKHSSPHWALTSPPLSPPPPASSSLNKTIHSLNRARKAPARSPCSTSSSSLRRLATTPFCLSRRKRITG